MVDASRKHETSVAGVYLKLVPNEHTIETALAEAGAHRLLAAVAALQSCQDGQLDQLRKHRQRAHRG